MAIWRKPENLTYLNLMDWLYVNDFQGLVSQVMGFSGSAMAPWAFSLDHERTARDVAASLNCNHTDPDDLVTCLKKVDVVDLLKAEDKHRVTHRFSVF